LRQIIDYLGDHTPPPTSALSPTPASPVTAPPKPASPPARHGLRIIAAPAVGLSILTADPVVLIEDDGGVARELATILERNGAKVEVCATVPEGARQVVFLPGLDALQGADGSLALHRRALVAARTLAPEAMTFVTVQDTGGRFGLGDMDADHTWASGLTGLAKTARLEWPAASVKAIDIATRGASSQEIATRLANELLTGGPEVEVALDLDGQRHTLRTEPLSPVEARADTLPVDETSVIVASGGARGVTARCLIELANAAHPRFVLLGRTPLTDEPASLQGIDDEAALKRALLDTSRAAGESLTPPQLSQRVSKIVAAREVRATLQALEDAGSQAEYIAVDVRNFNNLHRCLAPVREKWGPITGIVHAAGVLADKLIAEKTDEGFDRVFATKVEGLQALLSATREDPLRFIALFSSVAGRTGNVGQSDYAMANEVLNKVAQAEAGRRGASCVTKSLNWGPWAGGMVSPALEAHFESQGVSLIDLGAGARAFVAELCDPSAHVEVVLGDGLPQAADGALRFHVNLKPGSDDYLEGHCILETPVLPVTIVLEWFTRAARAYRSDLQVHRIRDLKVLRGLKLEHFRNGEERFAIEARAQGPNGKSHLLNLELRTAQGNLHYTATAELGPEREAAPAAPSIDSLDESPWSLSELYGHLLFHGPSFHVIEALEGVSAHGSQARLSPMSALGWNIESWQLDAAILDGGLQLAIIQGALSSGKESLPTSIGEYRDFGLGPRKAPVQCLLFTRQVGAHKIVCDLSFVDDDGSLLAQMHGVEMHFRGEPKIQPTPGNQTAAAQ
ncbi:MAG: SDR family NAD(P)-dependent oxidoreductase, partial [Bradymonadaceae bacterium]